MIDPKASVHPGAELGAGVEIGPGAVVGKGVELGDDCVIGPYAVIKGPTRIGRGNRIFQFASIGDDPQDKKYQGEPESRLEIGAGNVIREFCSINRGTALGGGVTRIGDNNWIMAYVHVAHDCLVGSNTVFANNAALAGHVTVEDFAILGGCTGVHQFCRMGRHSITAIATIIVKDVPPFLMVAGNTARHAGLNKEGLRRNGFSQEAVKAIEKAYRVVYRERLILKDALERLETLPDSDGNIGKIARFIRESERGIVR